MRILDGRRNRVYGNTPGASGVLPTGAAKFFKRRLAEVLGIALFCTGLLLTLALLSYTPGDPSLNSAGGHTVGNLLGQPGALIADLTLQSFGLAGTLLLLTLVAWGWRLAAKRGVSVWGFRLVLLAFAMILAAAALNALPIPANWPLISRLGGVTGTLVFERISGFGLLFGIASDITAVMLGAIALGLLIPALGLSWREWHASAQGVRWGLALIGRGAQKGRDAFGVVPAWRTGLEEMLDRSDKDQTEELEPGFDPVSVGGRDGSEDNPTAPKRTGLVSAKKSRLKPGRRAQAERQGRLNLDGNKEYQTPPLGLLDKAEVNARKDQFNKYALQENARFLARILEDFGVHGEIVKVRPGPVVTLYELEPAPGTKTSRVIGLSDDIARSMSAVSVRIAVVPGQNVIGIELPNVSREMVGLSELLASEPFEKATGKLPLSLGKDIGGAPMTVDLARMPHLLIAGTTGSGKSVAMNTMILSLLYRLSPDQCKLIMIDPKMLELSVYEGIPHLLTPVVTEPSKAIVALKWTVREMEDRYRAMSQLGVRNIIGYNARLEEAHKKGEELTRRVQTGFDDDGKPVMEEQPLDTDTLPYIVVVVDEMADLMLVAGKDVEAAIQRLAQMARAAGIHLIMATQRPSVDVITGTIKANFPTRISFQVTSKIDSRTILGEQGAETLLGQGDMLYMAGGGRISRIHGPFVGDDEVERVVAYLKAQGTPDYIEEITREEDTDIDIAGGGSKADALYDDAVALIAREGKASTSFIQRHLQIGYNRAARIIEQMEKDGVVSSANRVGRREVLIGHH